MPLTALRQRLAEVIAPPRAPGDGIPTGIASLDAALSDGGIPCGRLTEIVGSRGSGKTTLVRELVAGALEAKRWVAYIDAGRTLAPEDWARLAASGRLWIVRPPASVTDRAAWCADVLLRSGAFGLVVLDGAPPVARGVAVRLTRLARESHAAFVVMRDDETPGALTGGAVRIRLTRRVRTPPAPVPVAVPHDGECWQSLGRRVKNAAEEGPPGATWEDGRRAGARQRRTEGDGPDDVHSTSPPAQVQAHGASSMGRTERTSIVLTLSIEKGGTHHSVEVGCAIDVARRLCANPEVPDRRGVAPRNRRGERAAPNTPGARRTTDASDGHGASGATLARKRRFAEPAVGRDEFLLGRRETGTARREPGAGMGGRKSGIGNGE